MSRLEPVSNCAYLFSLQIKMTGQNDGTTTLKAAATDSVDKQGDDAGEGDTADESKTAAAQTTATTITGDQFDDKYQQFKGDPEKMQQMNDFVSGLLDSAEKEAETKLVARKVCIHIGGALVYTFCK